MRTRKNHGNLILQPAKKFADLEDLNFRGNLISRIWFNPQKFFPIRYMSCLLDTGKEVLFKLMIISNIVLPTRYNNEKKTTMISDLLVTSFVKKFRSNSCPTPPTTQLCCQHRNQNCSHVESAPRRMFVTASPASWKLDINNW